jgi:VanZ family protein
MKFRFFVKYWLPVLSYMGLIFYLSSLSTIKIAAPSSGLGLNDKILHFFEYAILTFLIHRLISQYNFRHPLLLSFCLSVVYGISDEIHQLYVPGRVFSHLDMLANSLGALSIVVLNVIKDHLNFPGTK